MKKIFYLILFVLLISCNRPLFVFHWMNSKTQVKFVRKKGYGLPSHNIFSRCICFDKLCRNKGAWLKKQKNTGKKIKLKKRAKPGSSKAKTIKEEKKILKLNAKSPGVVESRDSLRESNDNSKEKIISKLNKENVSGQQSEPCYIYFKPKTSHFEESEANQLDSICLILNKYLKWTVRIEGHSDDTGSGDFNSNLSIKRAKTVENYFIKKGVAKNRILTKGFGNKKPIGSNTTDEGRQLNRRVEISIIKKE